MAAFFDYPEELRLLQGELITRLTDAEFFDFCQANPLLHFERNANHEILIIPPPTPIRAKMVLK